MRKLVPALALLASACAQKFTPPSLLDDLRVLALVADPTDAGPADVLRLRAVTSVPGGGAPDSERWSFCPISLGSATGYACGVAELPCTGPGDSPPNPYCQVDAAGLVTATVPPGLPPDLPPQVDTFFSYTVTKGSDRRVAIQQVAFHPAGAPEPRNLPPVIRKITVGGAQAWPLPSPDVIPALVPGGELDVEVLLDAPERYRDPAGRVVQESLVVSFYTTAGRFDFNRANGPDARVKLKHQEIAAGTGSADLWVVARDLRGAEVLPGCSGPLSCSPAPVVVPIR